MAGSDVSLESRRAEKSKIAANWLLRMRQCMTTGDGPTVFEDALREAQITPAHLDGRLHLEQRQLDKVIASTITKVPDISLRMFARAELTDLGVMGYAAINSDTVGTAMRFLFRYHELTSDRYIDELTIDGDSAIITVVPLMAHIRDFRNITEDSFAGNWRTLHLLLGDAVNYKRARISFDYPPPSYESAYSQVFSCPCEFNALRSELQFPATWLKHPVASANQTMADVCTAMCERLLGAGESSTGTVDVVRRLLLSRPGRRMYRLDEAAAELRLSTAQLRKRLYRAGTSYKELVLEIRMALARHYLDDTDLAVQEIAYLLDYSQPAPFSRAFKNYYGIAPDHSRARRRELPGIP